MGRAATAELHPKSPAGEDERRQKAAERLGCFECGVAFSSMQACQQVQSQCRIAKVRAAIFGEPPFLILTFKGALPCALKGSLPLILSVS